MKELRALDRGKRANINEHRLKERFSDGGVGPDLRNFDPENFDEDLVNFYLKEPMKQEEPSFAASEVKKNQMQRKKLDIGLKRATSISVFGA